MGALGDGGWRVCWTMGTQVVDGGSLGWSGGCDQRTLNILITFQVFNVELFHHYFSNVSIHNFQISKFQI